ncbi:MAG: serine/threonine-protein kinase [Myxococcota bacterium]
MIRPQSLTPGSRFGRYNIIRLVGTGGTGAVYEAEHVGLKKRVAIKVLLPELAQRRDHQERFLREGEASSRVHHPHVVDVNDVGIVAEMPYLVMEYLEGRDLASLIAEQGHLPVEQLADLMVPTCAALAEAHRQGVIHRDLKPANIFLVNDPLHGLQPKIVDFGISKITDGEEMGLTTAGALLGTPSYMSPEQAKADPSISARTDQYSLGVIMLEAATGQRAFKATSMYEMLTKIVSGVFEPPRALRAEIPPEFEAIILRAMRTEPEERYPSMLDLGLALLPFAGERTRLVWDPVLRQGGRLSTSVPPRVSGGPRSTPAVPVLAPEPRSNALVIGAGVMGVLAVGVALGLFFRPSSEVLMVPPPAPHPVIAPAAAPRPSPSPRQTPSQRPSQTPTATASPSLAKVQTSTPAAAAPLAQAIAPTPTPTPTPTASPSPTPHRADCPAVTVSKAEIKLSGGKTLQLPLQRRGEILVVLDAEVGRKCPRFALTIDPAVPYAVAYPTIATLLQHTRAGVEIATDGAPIVVPAGLGAASINMLAVEITERELRFRVLVGGELPKRGSPLAEATRPLARRDTEALGRRLDALAQALPREHVVYLGATAAVPFAEVRAAAAVITSRFAELRLSWIE